MGIQGLLPLLKSIQKPAQLKQFAGQCLGVDAYGWLHRGTVACAMDLALGKPTRKHIDFALNRVRMLIHYGVKPYLVFDGDNLPSKAGTEAERRERRKESKRLGMELYKMGRETQAYQELQKAVDVTPTMARELIEELKLLKVDYIVAPFEADSQLVYLEKNGYISGILSEDSDMLVFGAKCLLTKLEQHGDCVMIRQDEFISCREVSFVGWQLNDFRDMAILSGCDYLPGIPGMGPKTAHRLLRKHKTVARSVKALQFDGKKKVPAGYLEAFTKAERTFLYQWVYCPEAQALVNFNPVPSDLNLDDMPYIGEPTEPQVATAIAVGDIDPHTKRAIVLDMSNRRSSVTVSTPIDKVGKPITDFFRPARIPLQELDPNSLTPSPSQQHLLQSQQNRSWSASHISRANTIAAHMMGSRSAPRASLPRASNGMMRSNNPLQSNRARFCAEDTLLGKDKTAVASTKSRFFGEPSPTVRKASAKKVDDFELFSDDSVGEVAAAICSEMEMKAEPPSKKRKKLAVYEDARVEVAVESQSSTTTHDSSTSTTTTTSESTGTESTSFTSTSSLSQGVNATYAMFRSKHVSSASSTPKCTDTHTGDALVLHSSPPASHNDTASPRPEMVGSEDLLVPQSPSNNEADEEPTQPRTLDFSRFAYTA